MPCEVCGREVTEESSSEPKDDEYIVWVTEDPDDPDVGLNKNEYQFCSLGHFLAFHPDGAEAIEALSAIENVLRPDL